MNFLLATGGWEEVGGGGHVCIQIIFSDLYCAFSHSIFYEHSFIIIYFALLISGNTSLLFRIVYSMDFSRHCILKDHDR